MKAKWYENLRTILKNSEKDADFLRRGNFWHVRGMRGKTQLTMRIQEGLGPSNPRSTCMLDLVFFSGAISIWRDERRDCDKKT